MAKPAKKKVAKKWKRPAKDDLRDKRCAMVKNKADEKLHPLSTLTVREDWCYGCLFYVCDGCSRNLDLPGGNHDVMDHLDSSDDDEGGDE